MINDLIVQNNILSAKNGTQCHENLHIYALLTFEDADYGNALSVAVNGDKYELNVKYKYRSQGNIHIIFKSEDGYYTFLSLDGHKGDVFINDNPLISKLVCVLNSIEIEYKQIDFKCDASKIIDILKQQM